MVALHVWLFILGGAALVVLGIFLYRSERRLAKARRRPGDEFHRSQFSQAERSGMSSPVESTTTNADLVEEISSLSSRLQQRERRIEELQSEHRQWLSARYDHQELQRKITNLTKQIYTNEWRLSESARDTQQLGQRNTHLQNEVSELKQQLQASQTRIQELEFAHQRLREQLQTAESSLATTTRQYNEIRDRYTRLQSGSARSSEESDPLVAMDSKDPVELSLSAATKPGAGEETVAELRTARDRLSERLAQLQNLRLELTSGEGRAKIQAENKLKHAVWSLAKRRWRVGTIPARAALAIVGASAIGFVAISSDGFFGSSEPDGALDRGYDQESIRVQGTSATPPKSAPSVAQNSPPASKSRLKGTFKTIQPTELFTGPSEDSAFITTIGPGTKIDVVDSRVGWLEIRGLGRRSGFVRQESAVRIDPK